MNQRLVAIGMGLGILLCAFSLGKGNQQIIAWPVAVWVVLLAWPRGKADLRQSAPDVGFGRIFLRAYGAPISALILLTIGVMSFSGAVLSKSTLEAAVCANEMKRAEDLFRAGNIDGALRGFAAIHVPEHMAIEKARQHHNCAVILIQLRRPDEAVEHLLLSLKYDPTDAQAAYLLGVLAAEKGRIEEAKIMVDMALSVRPDFEPAWRLRERLESALRSGSDHSSPRGN